MRPASSRRSLRRSSSVFALSSTKIFGFIARARAMLMRCIMPDDKTSETPWPKWVLYPCGRRKISSSSPMIWAARRAASIRLFGPNIVIFSSIVPLKMTGCGAAYPICLRRLRPKRASWGQTIDRNAAGAGGNVTEEERRDDRAAAAVFAGQADKGAWCDIERHALQDWFEFAGSLKRNIL